MDSGERKKRKKDDVAGAATFEDKEEEGKNEDEKMEEFFALIRSTRDVKERLSAMSTRPTTSDHNVGRGKTVAIGNKPPPPAPPVWYPTFQPEDFMENRPEPPNRPVESSITCPPNPPPAPPDLNINIANAKHVSSEGAEAGRLSSNKTGEEDEDDDNHDLDLNLSL